MILVDTNIIMYAAGGAHPHRAPCLDFLDRFARGEVEASIDAEVLQEILHRYRAIGRWADGRAVYDSTRRLFPQVIPITVELLDEARNLMDGYPNLMARDALHAAAVRQSGAEALLSYDRGFDLIDDFARMEPATA